MTLPEEFKNAVREWFEEHGPVECTRANDRTDLMATYKRVVPGRSEKQAEAAVKTAVRKIRGIITPQHTHVGLKRKAVGEPTSHHEDEVKMTNDINNPRNNPQQKIPLFRTDENEK